MNSGNSPCLEIDQGQNAGNNPGAQSLGRNLNSGQNGPQPIVTGEDQKPHP